MGGQTARQTDRQKVSPSPFLFVGRDSPSTQLPQKARPSTWETSYLTWEAGWIYPDGSWSGS